MTIEHWRPFCLRLRRASVLAGMMLLLLSATLFGAEHRPRKVVRVAYQEFNRQMIVDERNQPVAGYAYDYIQTLGVYAGWDVKYVPCSSFFDSVRQLRAGKVDLICEISYTEERAKELLFPNEPMGYEYCYLYSSAENSSITPGDYASMNGKTVGVTSGTILADLLKQWSQKKNIEFKIVEFEEIAKKEAALHAGRIDLDLELSMLAKRNLSAVEKVGTSAYYLVAAKNRPDLIDDINSAMEKVLNNDLFYFSRLQERYFSDTVVSRNLTVEEKEWLAEHKVLRVGYFDNYLPFSAKDENGKPVGACIETVRARGVLKVGTTGDYKPMSFRDPATGIYWGFDAALAEELARSLGVKLEYVPTTWPTLMRDTLDRRFDLALCGITITPERRKQALMSEGYLANGKTVLCRAEDARKYTTLAAIDRPEVRVMENPGGLNEKFARRFLPHATLLIHPVNEEIPALIASGQADVMITEVVEAAYYCARDRHLAAPLPDAPFTRGEIGALLPPGSEELREHVDRFLARARQSGKLAEWRARYLECGGSAAQNAAPRQEPFPAIP